jgi:hypothetical protein
MNWSYLYRIPINTPVPNRLIFFSLSHVDRHIAPLRNPSLWAHQSRTPLSRAGKTLHLQFLFFSIQIVIVQFRNPEWLWRRIPRRPQQQIFEITLDGDQRDVGTPRGHTTHRRDGAVHVVERVDLTMHEEVVQVSVERLYALLFVRIKFRFVLTCSQPDSDRHKPTSWKTCTCIRYLGDA